MNDRALWDDETTKIFIHICLEQIYKKERRGLSFLKPGWDSIVLIFNEKTGKSYEKKQLKNKFDMLRKDLRTWDSLTKETSVGRDPVTNNVIASNEWWQRKCQENSAYRKFRHASLKHERELRIIYKDVVATREDMVASSFTQTQTEEAGQEDVHRSTMDEDEGLGDSEDALFGVNLAASTGVTDELASIGLSTQTPPFVPIDSESHGTRKRVDQLAQKKKQKMLASKQIADAISVIAKASKDRAAIISEIQARSIDAAISNLLDLDEVQQDEEFQVRCIRLLMDKTSRDAFFSLLKRNKDSLIGWLRYMVTTLD